MDSKIKNFQQILAKDGLNGFIVTNPYNTLYLTGFKGISDTEREVILVVTSGKSSRLRSNNNSIGSRFPFLRQDKRGNDKGEITLIVPKLYQTEALKIKSKGLHIKIVRERNEIFEVAKKLLSKCQKVGFEEENLTFSEYQEFKNSFRGSTPKLAPCSNLIENLRLIKSPEEIKKIERAQVISQKAFYQLVKTLKLGQTEEEIASQLKSIIQKLGGQGLAFESIIASGRNSGLPHHVTGKRRLAANDMLLLDFGAKYQNYCADLTRVIFIGRVSDRNRNIFSHVLTAQRQAIKAIAVNINSSNVYSVANNHFKKHKLHNNFTHGLGHGVGLEIHEAPHLRLTVDDPLTEGMVFSIEPGLYFPWGGVRIEDLVTIKNGKAKVLGKTVEEVIKIQL